MTTTKDKVSAFNAAMDYISGQSRNQWIETHKHEKPFAAGALAYIDGRNSYYGCHYGLRSSGPWAREQFSQGWNEARQDCR